MSKKFNKRRVLNYLAEYLILNLNEFKSLKNLSDFGEGELWAYIDCLEILSNWSGFKKFGITDVESYFNAK